jgi:hypothetical protein
MGMFRLYRKFYCVSTSGTGNTYTLITPTSVSAESYVAGTGGTNSNTLIETGLTLTEEETGIFYTDLDPTLYTSDVTYDLVFYVQYTPEAPLDKKLITRFRIKPFNIANQLDFEISDVRPIEYEILGTYN